MLFYSVGAMQADGELGNLFDGDIMLSPGTAADEVQVYCRKEQETGLQIILYPLLAGRAYPSSAHAPGCYTDKRQLLT